MTSHYSISFSNGTFGYNNPYIPAQNYSIQSGPQTRVSSKQGEQLNFQGNLNNTETLIYYPSQRNNNRKVPTNSINSIIKGLMPNKQSEKDILHPQSNNYNATNPKQ